MQDSLTASLYALAPVTSAPIVMKFGGTSVASLAHIRRVAARVAVARGLGQQVVLVVSAMAGETNRLLGMARNLAPNASARELDVLAATGEQVVASLTAIALHSMGVRARSFLGHQVRIITDGQFGDAEVEAVDAAQIRAALLAGEVPVVAGFQGIDADGNITTLGRGGSDTTAVAVAAALGAAACEIFTDVDGVYDRDPRINRNARKLPRIAYQDMYVMAASGAKVLHDKSVLLAARHGVALLVRSSFSDEPGTWIGEPPLDYDDRITWNQLDTRTHQEALLS